jgi:hypothetical protein
MSVKYHPFGRFQRAARVLLELEPVITTKMIMSWANADRGTRNQRKNRSRCARRACRSLGLVRVGRIWPDGNIWAKTQGKQ